MRTIGELLCAFVDSSGIKWRACKVRCAEEYVRFALHPLQKGASPVEIYVYDDEGGPVGVAAGLNVYFNIPDDIDVPPGVDSHRFLLEIVKSICNGSLCETVYLVDEIPFRWVFDLPVLGENLHLDRMNVPRRMRYLGQEIRELTLLYRNALVD